jgi:hypothetical protein
MRITSSTWCHRQNQGKSRRYDNNLLAPFLYSQCPLAAFVAPRFCHKELLTTLRAKGINDKKDSIWLNPQMYLISTENFSILTIKVNLKRIDT